MQSWIKLQNVSLDIPIYGADKSFRSILANRYIGGKLNAKKKSVSVTALNGINIFLEEGDRLALIGHNGAGKSTLLSVLAGIYAPTQGKISHHGKITPLFNITPGLDPADTGLENIKTIATYLGMTNKEIKDKTDDIVNFSELEDYVKLPVRTYSAGMISRLCFGIATAIQSNILLVDEGIGAGDNAFAEKAKKRLENFYSRTDIIVLASHSKELVQRLCNKAILLEHGQIICSGTVEEVFEKYYPVEANKEEAITT